MLRVRVIVAGALAIGASLVTRAPALAAVTTGLDGAVGAFYNRNFGNYLGAVAPVQGENVGATLWGGIFDDRLLRYTLGTNLVEGRSLGLAHRIHILDAGTQSSLLLFPIKWYQLGLAFGASRLRLQDGPEYSWSSWSRSWSVDVSARPPVGKYPGIYSRYGDFRYRTTLEATRGEQRRLYTLRLDESFTANTRADATYDLTDVDYLRSSAAYRNHRILANFFSRPVTATTVIMRASANWYDNRFDTANDARLQILGYQAYLLHDITPDDQLTVSEQTASNRGSTTFILTNDLQGLWYHRFHPMFRGKTGLEFGHQATDGVVVGFAYQKFREAGLLGGDARIPAGDLEFDPNYTASFGMVQVESAGGGSFVRHEGALPVLYSGLEGMPMWLSGFLNVERDTSSVPTFRRYRALNYRVDVVNLMQGGAGYTTRLYFEAQRSRADEKILSFRSQLDETRLGVNAGTTINPFYSRFGLGYSIAWDETRLVTYNVHSASATWAYWPVRGLLFNNTINWTRTEFERDAPLNRLFYQLEAEYRWRALEFTSAFRYDSYDRQDASEWGVYFQVKRYFSYGG